MDESDKEVVSFIKTLQENIIKRRGNKAKAQELKRQFNVIVNHKKVGRICQEYGLLAQNRRRKHPTGYYAQQKEERKDLPKNILGLCRNCSFTKALH